VRPIQHILLNAEEGKVATERDRVEVYGRRTLFLGNAYTFVRLLRASRQTSAVERATGRLEQLFDEVLTDVKKHIDFAGFEVVDCDRLARVSSAAA